MKLIWTFAAGLLAMAATAASARAANAVPAAATTDALRADLKRIAASDIIRNPKPVVAELPALIGRAERNPGIAFAEIVAARHILAFARTYDGDHAGGIAELDALAAELRRRNVAGPLYDETQRRKAVILSALKKFDEAAAIYQDILAREERAGRSAGALASATLNGLAVLRGRQGKYDEGEALGRRATAAGLAAPDATPLAVGDAWRTWVVLLGLAGKNSEAIAEAQKSLNYIARNLPEGSESTVGAMNSLSSMLADAGRYAEAEAIQRRLIAVEERQPTTQGQTMSLYLGNFGSVLMSQGKAAEAEPILRHARELMLKVAHPQRPDFQGILTMNLGVAVEAQGRRDEALALFRQAAAELARDAGTDHPTWAHAQNEIGRMLLDQGDPTAALGNLGLAHTVMAARLDRADHLRLSSDLLIGEARLRTGDAAGYAMARAAIAAERVELINAALDPLRSALMARERTGNFMRFARLALERGEVADAFEAVQLAQFGDLDSAGAAWMVRQTAATPALGGLVADLQAAAGQLKRLQASRTKAVAAGDAPGLATADREIETARARATALNVRLGVEFPAYTRLVRPEPRALAAVQAALAPDEALIVATPADDGNVVSLLVTRTSARGATATLPRDALRQWSTRLRTSIDEAADDPATAGYDAAAAHALFAAIVPPALDRRARRARHLMVQTGGILASVPIAALLTARPTRDTLAGTGLRDAPWLVRRQALSRPVSLAMLGLAAPVRATIRFAAVGAPTLKQPATGTQLAAAAVPAASFAGLLRAAPATADFVSDLPSLPAAERELRAIASAFGEAAPLMLVGDAATEANLFARDLTQYNVIAFATHGLVGGELRNLTEPALVMTPRLNGSADDDGLLTASEVARLRLNADWIILSACNTSAGEGGAAPIYTGLARAFVQAGARSLLLSHWPLRDDIAAQLTVATVRMAAAGRSRPEALRQAQLALLSDRTIAGAAHPVLWAPLSLIGE